MSALTGVVAGAGGTVTDLTTRLAGDLYVLVAEVTVPSDVEDEHLEALEQALRATADELGVDVSWRATDPDDL